MSNPHWRRCLQELSSFLHGELPTRRSANRRRGSPRPLVATRLEELETRLAPASFVVNAQLQITLPSEPRALATGIPATTKSPAAHAVVFFESSVANYQVLRQGLPADTDSVVLDCAGDGLMEMAAFLANRRDLTAIGVVAHGGPGAVSLGTGILDEQNLASYAPVLAALGSALRPGGELDLWSCDVAAGKAGAFLVHDLAIATGTGVAAADHTVGSTALGGTWQLNVRLASTRAEVPFTAAALEKFQALLTWSTAASMGTARLGHTATLLKNGKVLVTGGNSTTGIVSSAELYDPVTNTWSSVGDMNDARLDHTATLLSDGRVLIAGGMTNVNNHTLASAELYDPNSNSWSSAGSMATPRLGQTAMLLGNGKVLVLGGFAPGVVLTSTELYDPASNTWSSAASMPTARQNPTVTLLANGKVLVAGGGDVNNQFLTTSTELYDPASDIWSSAASMPTAREAANATLLANGKVLVVGGLLDVNNHVGKSAELYDPASNTWSSAGAMATGRVDLTATLLHNGRVLIAGGTDEINIFSSAELYDSVSNTWSAAGSMSAARWGQTATLLNNGRVLITGGDDPNFRSDVILSGAELYDPGVGLIDPSESTLSVAPATISPGGTATITLTTRDVAGNLMTSGGLPFTFGLGTGAGSGTFSNLTDNHNGTYTATFTGISAGPITITAKLNGQPITSALPTITVNSGGAIFLVSIPSGNTIVAGNPFLITMQAVDASGNPVTNYTGPSTVTVGSSPPDPQSNFTGTLNSSGFGFFLGNLKTAGSYTLTATAGAVSGTSGSLTVIPSDASYFTVTAPAAATTGGPFNATVTAIDHFGNIATGYTGTVRLTSSDPAAATQVSSYTFTTGPGNDNGVHTFSGNLKTGGSQTITATDTAATNPAIVGTSNPITTRGLVVTAFTPTATGFTATFSEPFTPGNISLWGGTVAKPVQNVTLVGDKYGPVNGSLLIDPTSTSIVFKASAIYLSTFFQTTVLPNDTWHVTLASGSGSDGFLDALGAGLDGDNTGGHADYTTTFTTNYDDKPALSIPDFARGPDSGHAIKVPNESAAGIPVTLSNAALAKDVVFALSYNPQLLTPTGAGTADAPAGSSLTLGGITGIDATHAVATFAFHDDVPQNGAVVLGDILASVPDSAASQYKAKELLSLGSITVNGAPFTGAAAGGLHVNAYLGDVSGNGTITGLDVATASSVAQGSPSSPLGLAAYRLVDPAIVGDIAGDASIDATAVSDLAMFTANLKPAQIPPLPTGLTITPGGPDPTLSLGSGEWQSNGEGENGREGDKGDSSVSPLLPLSPSPVLSFTVPVLLDNPRPEGSTGMTEAILALTYDPKVLAVSAADITLGSIPGLAGGWQLVSMVDPTTGRIGIDLYCTAPIAAAQAGSLVNIVFHMVPGASAARATVQLVSSVAVNGQYFATQVDDDQGQLLLSSGKG